MAPVLRACQPSASLRSPFGVVDPGYPHGRSPQGHRKKSGLGNSFD